MQRFKLSPNDTNKLLTREPLLIVRLSMLQTGLTTTPWDRKKETLSRSYICLVHIPLKLDDDDLVHLKMERLSWLILVVEVLWIAPPYSIMGEPLFRHIFTYPWSHKRRQASSIWSLLDAHLELALWLDLPRIISSFFIEMMSWS